MRHLKRIVSFLLVTTLFITTVFAANNILASSIEEAKTIPTTGKAVSFSVTKDEPTYYGKFTVAQAGLVQLTVKKPTQGKINFKVLAEDKETVVLDKDFTNSSSSISEWLPKGTFYVVFTRHDVTGTVSVAAKYSKPQNMDTEPNNTQETAQTYNLGSKLYGLITWNDNYDIFKINVTKPGVVTLDLKKYLSGTIIMGVKNGAGETAAATTLTPAKNQGRLSVNLNKGTYYISIQSTNNSTGRYLLQSSWKLAKTDAEVNNTIVQAKNFALSTKLTKRYGFIGFKDTADYYKITLNRAGRVILNFGKEFVGDLSYQLLLPDDKTNILAGNVTGKGTEKKPITKQASTYLEKGTYYLKVYPKEGEQYSSGQYFIQSKFISVANDSTSNSNIDTPQRIYANGKFTNGCLTWQDNSDHYLVTTSKEGTLHITFKKDFTGDCTVEILNGANKNVEKSYAAPKKAGTYGVDLSVNKGSYIIKVVKKTNNVGTYHLKAQYK